MASLSHFLSHRIMFPIADISTLSVLALTYLTLGWLCCRQSLYKTMILQFAQFHWLAGPYCCHINRPNDRRGLEIATICALALEADAVKPLFYHSRDDEGSPFDKRLGDPNAYSTGMIGRHSVILSYMPGVGIVNASAVAFNCGKRFPGIKLALVVGVFGVVSLHSIKMKSCWEVSLSVTVCSVRLWTTTARPFPL